MMTFYAQCFSFLFCCHSVFAPTGAGDCCAGGFSGYLSKSNDLTFENMKAAVIGLGWWGKQIIKCLDDSQKITITHAYDPQIDRNDLIFSDFSVSSDQDFDAIIDNPDIDAVILATPNQFHESQVISAANKGKQVFCEKPVALKYESVKKMAQACQDNNVILGVGHERRWEPAMAVSYTHLRAHET